MKLCVVVIAAFLLKLASSKLSFYAAEDPGFEQNVEAQPSVEYGHCAPLSVCGLFTCKEEVSSVLVTPDNVMEIASFIIPNAEIADHAIYFPPGEGNEKLLEVPIRAARCFAEQSKIRITVGLDENDLTSENDRDPRFGITDGININDFWVCDTMNYGDFPPCLPADGAYVMKLIDPNSPAPAKYSMVLHPVSRFGECSFASAAAGGIVVSGKFDNQLDVNKGLNLIVQRHDKYEDYHIYYILVEVLL